MSLGFLASLAAGLFCFARGAVDLRQRRFVWGVLGIAAGMAIVLTPVPSHGMTVGLPIND